MAKKLTKTRTARKAPARPKRATSTALTIRRPKVEVLPPAVEKEERRIGDGIMIGQLGLVELKLTDAEELVLAEPVNEADVMIKPTGAVYLPHAKYTKWLCRALGRLSWSLVPLSSPVVAKNTVAVPYLLYIHGQPVAFAWGEQDYFESNKDQSYGDALESTVASGLRRCCKRIGIASELWDRDWANAWRDRHAIQVMVKRPKDPKARKQWRRPEDPRLAYEQGRAGRPRDDDDEEGEEHGEQSRSRQRDERRQETSHGHQDELITKSQLQKLAMTVNRSARSDVEVTDWLRAEYGLQGDKVAAQIKRRDFDAICNAIEAPGSLPRRRK